MSDLRSQDSARPTSGNGTGASDDEQRAHVERRAAAEGIEPYDLLQRWASEHLERAKAAEGAASDARRSERACRADAHRWYGRVPVADVEVGETIWVYTIASNEGWDWVSRTVVGKGTTTTEQYGDVPYLRLRGPGGEYDWTLKPDMLIDVQCPG